MAKTEVLLNLRTFFHLPFHMWSEYLANPKSWLNFNELIPLFNMDLNSTPLFTDINHLISPSLSPHLVNGNNNSAYLARLF